MQLGFAAVEGFNTAFDLKEAGNVDAALEVWKNADELFRRATWPRPDAKAFADMVRCNVLGSLRRHERRRDEARQAYDEALRVAARFYAVAGRPSLDATTFEPPVLLVAGAPEDEVRLVASMLTKVFYNRANLNLDLGSPGEYLRLLVYALDVALQLGDELEADAHARTVVESACTVLEPWSFVLIFAAYHARRLELGMSSIDVATSPAAAGALAQLEALVSGMVASDASRGAIETLFHLLQHSSYEAREDADVLPEDDFSRLLLNDLMTERSITYVASRLLLTAVVRATGDVALFPFVYALAEHAYRAGNAREVVSLLELVPADRLSSDERAARTTLLANAYSDLRQSTRAVELYSSALEDLAHPDQRLAAAVVRAGIADDALLAKDPARAYDVARTALDDLPADADSEGRGWLLLNLGAAAVALGRYDVAEDSFREAIALADRLPLPRLHHKALANLGQLTRVRDPERAHALFDEAIEESGRLGHFVDQAHYLFSEALTRDESGEIAAAADGFRAALSAARLANDERLQGLIIAALAGIYIDQYDDATAERYLREALALPIDDERRAQITGNLALVCGRLGKLEQAEALWDEAEEIARSQGLERLVVDTLNNRAAAAYGAHDFVRTMLYADRAFELAEAAGHDGGVAFALMVMGNVSLAMRQAEAAIVFHSAALPKAERVGDARSVTKLRGFIGIAHMSAGRHETAREYLRAAIEAAQRRGSTTDVVSWTYQLAKLEDGLDDHESAFDGYRRTIELLEQVRGDRELLAEAPGQIGTLVDPFDAYARASVLALKLGRADEALAIVERSRSRQFLDMLGEHQAVRALRTVVIEDPRLRHHVATGRRSSTQPAGEVTAVLAEQRRAAQAKVRSYYDNLLAHGPEDVEEAAPGATPITWHELRRLMRE